MMRFDEGSDSLEEMLRGVDDVCSQLTSGIDGKLDFTLDCDTDSPTVAKLVSLMNYVLRAAKSSVDRTMEENRLLRRTDAMRSEFIANVSHELRTPLTLLMGPLAELIEAPGLPEDVHTNLMRVSRNADRLHSLVDGILELLRAEGGHITVSERPTDVRPFCASILDDYAVLARQKGVALQLDLEDVGTALLDPKLVEHVLLNLLGNAFKFTPAGGCVKVSLHREAGDLVFQISDDGIGIAQSDQAHLFERFRRAGNALHHEGTGLGLALVEKLVDLMGGTVSVESAEGRGATFSVRMPAPERPAGAETSPLSRPTRLFFDEALPSPREARPVLRGAPLSAPSVLIVDDHPEVRDLVTRVLEGDYRCAVAHDGKTALKLLAQRTFDVVITDVRMPEVDGFDLCRRIKSSLSHQHIPIIMLTGFGGTNASVTGLDAGADDYMVKPFDPAELKARVRAATRMSLLQAQLRSVARRQGMADVASSILHDIGNVLNSVNVSSAVISDSLARSELPLLAKAAQALSTSQEDAERIRKLQRYLEIGTEAACRDLGDMKSEIQLIQTNLEHIKIVVDTQQSYVRAVGLREVASLSDIMEDGIRITADSFRRAKIDIVRCYDEIAAFPVDRHRILEILLNLLTNARQAISEGRASDRRVTVQVASSDVAHVRISIVDNGVGIPPENMSRVFEHGFTTKRDGHGFGLHSSANAARALGGSLTCESEGTGRGATFILEIPIRRQEISA